MITEIQIFFSDTCHKLNCFDRFVFNILCCWKIDSPSKPYDKFVYHGYKKNFSAKYYFERKVVLSESAIAVIFVPPKVTLYGNPSMVVIAV